MNTFELVDQRYVSALQAMATVYRHRATGARHLHLATDELELGFLVAFPTLPDADDGRAHILEHTVLCGSERYPVRDPFFSMMQRSVSTFMNAMTFADRTVYPFSTTDPVDFCNLLDVYLDASFFPRLERMSFLQEGWRGELNDGRYAIQGVVFNEMKDSCARPHRALYRGVMQQLFAGTTYAHDSGGDPLSIPSLAYEMLREFHAQHYHPSQAVFMSSGPVDPLLVQDQLEHRVLARFPDQAARRLPGLAQRWADPREAVVRLPIGAGDPAEEHGLQMAWRFDPVATVDAKLRLAATMQLLAGHDGAPVPQAIRALGFGRLSDLSGPDTTAPQAAVHLGVSGLRAEQLDAAKAALLAALHAVARDGLPESAVGGVLRQMRFSERQQLPGLHRLMAVADAGLRGENLIDALDLEPALARLADQMAQPGFVQAQVRELLDCPNRLCVHVRPDPQHAAERNRREQVMLLALSAALDEPARELLQAQTAALAAHQQAQTANVDVLPRIRPSDMSKHPQPLMPIAPDASGHIAVPLATHGLSHAELVVDLSAFALEEAPWLALLTRVLPGLGAAGKAAAEALAWRETQVQDFRVSLATRPAADGRLQVDLLMSASALREDQDQLSQVLAAWFTSPALGDAETLRTLVTQDLQARMAELPSRAPEMAQAAMLAPWQPVAAFEDRVEGLSALSFYGELRQHLLSESGFALIQARLADVLRRVQAAPRHTLCAAMEPDLPALAEVLARALPVVHAANAATSEPIRPPVDRGAKLALQAPVQVNACGMAWRVPRIGSAYSPALAVAAQLLTQQFLHPAIRERGGAYGVQARYDGRSGIFKISTVADPRVQGTYADFAQALADVRNADLPTEAIDNAILSVIKSLDRPLLPFERLRQGWEAWRRGMPSGERERFREGVLSCTLNEVRQALAACLRTDAARCAAVVAAGLTNKELDSLQVLQLMELAAAAGCVEPRAALT